MRRIALLAALTLSACQAMDMSTTPAGRPPVASKPAPAAPAPAAPAASNGGPQIVLSRVSGSPGQSIKVSATLRTGGKTLAGTQNDIAFAPGQVSIAATSKGKPDCTPNAAIGKNATAFSFLPSGCKPGSCTSVRALVLSLNNVDPIDDGSLLYTCTAQITAGASGTATLALSHVGFSSPDGKSVNGSGANGSISIK